MNTRAIDLNPMSETVSNTERRVENDCIQVTVMWNDTVQEVLEIAPDKYLQAGFSVGEDPSADFLVPSDTIGGKPHHELVSLKGGVLAMSALDTMQYRVVTAGGQVRESLPASAGTEFLGPNDVAEIALGASVFRVQLSHRLQRPKATIQFDKHTKYFFGFSGLMHALVLALVYMVPPGAFGLSFDSTDQNSRFMKIMLAGPEIHQTAEPKQIEDHKALEEAGGKAHAGVSGEMGDRTAKRTRNRAGIKGPADNRDPKMARERLKDMATSAGILGFLSARKTMRSPFGTDNPLGFDPEDALGALTGDQIGPNFGYGGLGPKGTGRGGGGTGEGTIGVGRLGTISFTGGTGKGRYGKNPALGDLSGRRDHGPKIRSGGAMVKGSISKEVIRRIVRRNINQIKFCYEKGLMKRPDLSGRVAIRFVITGTGAVQTAVVSSTTIGDPAVESCIAHTVERMTFPMPPDSGIAIVTYPFTLSSPEAG